MSNNNTVEKGDLFEEKVYNTLLSIVENGEFGLTPITTKVFWKKAYYSELRKSNIIFDIAIESYLPNATEPSTLHLFECKNYESSVPVKEIEAFASKLNQVGEHNTKGYFITNNFYQRGALELAKSYKMGVAIFKGDEKFEWLSYRKDSRSPLDNNEEVIAAELCGDTGLNSGFSFYSCLDGWAVKSFPDLLITAGIVFDYIPFDKVDVKYLSPHEIEEKLNKLKILSCYDKLWCLDYEQLCDLISSLYDCEFKFDKDLGIHKSKVVLGKIVYNPLTIFVERGLKADINRFRFTLCHEIGHLILHHELLRKYFDSTVDGEDLNLTEKESSRIEYQANVAASLMLLPTKFINDFVKNYFKRNDIYKGHLYLDSQNRNQQLVFTLLDEISKRFQVSKEVAKIRLLRMNLLKIQENIDSSIGENLRKAFINDRNRRPF